MKLKKILVANRGEIALRIIKTIKEMGLEAVAMYVEIDKNSLYVQNSDHAFKLDNGYMDQDEIINKAKQFNVDAIHPCLLYTSPSPRDPSISRMPSSA